MEIVTAVFMYGIYGFVAVGAIAVIWMQLSKR